MSQSQTPSGSAGSSSGNGRPKYDEGTLKKWLADVDNGAPLMYVDLLSAIGHETPSSLRGWWVGELRERILEFTDYFTAVIDNREGVINRCNVLVVTSEGKEPKVITKPQLRGVFSELLDLSRIEGGDALRERFYTTLRTSIRTGQCIMCNRVDQFYPGIWPRTKKADVYRIPFTMRMWFNPSEAIAKYIAAPMTQTAPQPGDRRSRNTLSVNTPGVPTAPLGDMAHHIAGVCQNCAISCEACGNTMNETFDPLFMRAMAMERECYKCSRNKLTSVEPPKPNIRELKVYKQKFRDLTK